MLVQATEQRTHGFLDGVPRIRCLAAHQVFQTVDDRLLNLPNSFDRDVRSRIAQAEQFFRLPGEVVEENREDVLE